jgi:capsid portal protein
MSLRFQEKKDIRQACDEILKTAEEDIERQNKEIKRLNEEKDKQTRHYTRIVHRLNADKTHEADQLRESTAKLERAITTSQKLENEVSQLKQQLDDVRINTREVVAWVEVQPILDRIRGFISTGNTTWNEIQALENRHMTKQLPGDGVIQEPWSNPNVQFGMLDPNSLSSFPVHNNFALNAQPVPPLPGQYASLS